MIWTGERGRQQARLVAGMYQAAAGVPCERSAVIAGGLPGADKAAALEGSGVDRSRYLTVSIGTIPWTRWPGPGSSPWTTAMTAPLTRAGQVHAEAQHLAKRVLLRALMDGRNLILDISLASWRAAEAWTYALRFADYTLTAVFADMSVDEAVRRAGDARRRGEEEFRRGLGHGGRDVPAAAIRALASPARRPPPPGGRHRRARDQPRRAPADADQLEERRLRILVRGRCGPRVLAGRRRLHSVHVTQRLPGSAGWGPHVLRARHRRSREHRRHSGLVCLDGGHDRARLEHRLGPRGS